MNGACLQCARRSWLLGELSSPLDFRARDLARFWRILELPDKELIEATAGKRRVELHTAYQQWQPPSPGTDKSLEMICPHHQAYPTSLQTDDGNNDPIAPQALNVRGGVQRLTGMLNETVVAIVGTHRATDYGMETARYLAHGLAASGVTITSELAEGIPFAAHSGALQARDSTLTVVAGGIERSSPAWCEALYRRITTGGCAISETPPNLRAHRWCEAARARTLALLAQLVIVVEAEDSPWELACAHLAQARGKLVAAVPGRLSSRASKGTNSLLMNGAQLVRSPQDALELLYGVGTTPSPQEPLTGLEPRLQILLEQVGAGSDTVAKLTAHGAKPAEVVPALTELELKGLLLRGDGGRYLPCAGMSAK